LLWCSVGHGRRRLHAGAAIASSSESDDGWVSLFNGKSFYGWHVGIRFTGCNANQV